MQGNSISIEDMVEAATLLLGPVIIAWGGKYPLEPEQLAATLRAGIRAGLLGQSAQFYAAHWMAQCYLIKPDQALMAILRKLDAYCVETLAEVAP